MQKGWDMFLQFVAGYVVDFLVTLFKVKFFYQ